ncbi:MAG: GlsB/YeaQ/YmgE family stress response membrane protein [Pseudomonadota bacterium]
MSFLTLVLVGAIAGYLATRALKVEASPLVTVAIGVAGALLGGFLLQIALGILGFLGGVIGALIGAVLLIWLYQRVQTKK